MEMQAAYINPFADPQRAITASRWVWILPALMFHRPGPADGVTMVTQTDSLEQQKDISLGEALRKRILRAEVATLPMKVLLLSDYLRNRDAAIKPANGAHVDAGPGDIEAAFKRIAPAVHGDCVGRARAELEMKPRVAKTEENFEATDELVAVPADDAEIAETKKTAAQILAARIKVKSEASRSPPRTPPASHHRQAERA